jgi:hypothetical protein
MVAEETTLMQNDTVLQYYIYKSTLKHIQPFATKSAVLEKK